MKFCFLLLMCVIGGTSSLFAQQDYSLILKKGELRTENNVDQINPSDIASSLYRNNYYLLVQFSDIPSSTEVKQLKNKGIELLSYIPNMAYWTKVPKSSFKTLCTTPNVRSIMNFPSEMKYETYHNASQATFVNILLHEKITEAAALEIWNKDFPAWKDIQMESKYIEATLTPSQIEVLAQHPMVNYISRIAEKPNLLLEECKAISRVGRVKHSSGVNLTGEGVAVSVGDAGTINQHADLQNRIVNYTQIDAHGHGAHTASILGGEGILDENAEGFAPKATMYADYYRRVIQKDDSYYNNNQVVISNNSYSMQQGGGESPCEKAGIYNTLSNQVDESLGVLDEVVHVFASANSGNNICGALPQGYGTTHDSYNCAKNTLTVGNIGADEEIVSSSSRGPVKDGRIKPEIVAVGKDVYAAGMYNNYWSSTGTSFSCPAVAGGLALLYQQYKGLHNGQNPRGDVMKAMICNTAKDIGNPGPDFAYGFGSMDLYRATQSISANHFTTGTVSNGGNFTHDITIPSGTRQVKVMLYWTDRAAAPSANKALVNNLDMKVKMPNGTEVLPLVLDHAAANVTQNATQGVDDINNIEQVVINNPTAGTYTIQVAGSSVPMGNQNFAVVYDIVEDHLSLSSPIGGEIFSPDETIYATWNAAGDENNTYTVEYSLDNGANWVVVSDNFPGSKRKILIDIPNTYTNQGLVRITWNNSNLPSSQSLSNFSIMERPQNLQANNTCNKEVNLTWESMAGASSYDVLYLENDTLTLLTNTTDTGYNHTGLTAGNVYTYVVRAKTTDGIMSRNSSPVTVVAVGDDSLTSINTFPYFEDFENGNGAWVAYGKNNSWTLATPTQTILNRAAQGTKCWVTGSNKNYNDAEEAILVSPCFDLSSMSSPMISFAFIRDIEHANDGNGQPFYDYLKLQYSINGKTWQDVGSVGAGQNWYNNYTGENVWDDTKAHWHVASHSIIAVSDRVQFRFLFDTDPFTSQEGVAIDNIHIHEAGTIYTGVTTQDAQSVSGNNWIDFKGQNGKIIASILPNGNDLGTTNVDAYFHTGAIRHDSVQYYLDRNWRISATNALSSPVKVRLYFSDAEVDKLREKVSGTCSNCSSISDAFVAGITRYVGANENGTLADNDATGYTFLPSSDVKVVPYANGYYAEFETSDLAEFYLNGGHHTGDIPLPVELFDFILKVKTFPNPTQGEIHLDIETQTPMKISCALRDALGNRLGVKTITVNKGRSKITNIFRSLNLPAGVYYLTYTTSNERLGTERIMVY